MCPPAHTPSPIRVLLADDSELARSLLREIIDAEPDLQVAGEAANGLQACQLAASLKPDVICMDLEMPQLGGADAIDRIMHQKAIPILVVSSSSDAAKAFQALDLGALDVIAKPGLDPQLARELVDKIRLLAGVAVITRLRPSTPALPSTPPPPPEGPRNFQRLIAIACSTGGPQALARLLPQLDPVLPAPVLIGQHMSDGFAEGMAHWLNGLSSLPVKVAGEGDLLQAGTIYLSPPEQHMSVDDTHCIRLLPRQPDDLYHPSCDTLLGSVARVYGPDAIGLIMTGMGRDGSQGMQQLQQAGAFTLAQDEASSVIFGMNQEAIARGAIRQILPLDELPARLNQLALEQP